MCNEYEWVGYLCICKCICKRHIHYTSNRIDRYEFVRLGPLCDMSHSHSLHHSHSNIFVRLKTVSFTGLFCRISSLLYVSFLRLGPLCDMSHSHSLHTCYIREAHEYNMCAMNMGLCVICTATIFEYRISDRDVLAYPYLRILKHVV